jgi:Uma2 family endonuclease
MVNGVMTGAQVSAEEYLERYASEHYEWVAGELIKMSPIRLSNYYIQDFLKELLKAYLGFNPIGLVVGEPFVMRLEAMTAFRLPDLQVILKTNPGQLTETAMIGPADICIEVVSPESAARDYGEKFIEYEKGGVREYWIVDAERQSCTFNRLNPQGVYARQNEDADGNYQTPLLPGFRLHVPTLWRDPLPTLAEVVELARAMVSA